MELKKYSNAIVYPPQGIFNCDGKFIKDTYKRRIGTTEWMQCDNLPEKEIQEITDKRDETVIFVGFIRQHYGHFLIDSCGRMWGIIRQNDLSKVKVILTAYESEICGFVKLFFEGLGLTANQYELVQEPRIYSTIIIPDVSFYPGIFINNDYWVNAFDTIIKKVIDEGNYATFDKIYLSQTRLKKNDDLYGEKLIETIFSDNGYKILFPEEMSLYEQVAIYNNASTIVCTNGTLSHNGVWMRENSKLIVLDRFIEKAPNSKQKCIDEMRNYEKLEMVACHKWSLHDCGYMMLTKPLREWMGENHFSINTYHKSRFYDRYFYKYLIVRLKWLIIRIVRNN